MDYRKPGSQAEPGSFLGLEGAFKSQSNGYPGGIFFDPLGFSRYLHLLGLQALWRAASATATGSFTFVYLHTLVMTGSVAWSNHYKVLKSTVACPEDLLQMATCSYLALVAP